MLVHSFLCTCTSSEWVQVKDLISQLLRNRFIFDDPFVENVVQSSAAQNEHLCVGSVQNVYLTTILMSP